jgi:hypothetical protein
VETGRVTEGTSEQLPCVNNGNNFGVFRVVVVLRFDCTGFPIRTVITANLEFANKNSILAKKSHFYLFFQCEYANLQIKI